MTRSELRLQLLTSVMSWRPGLDAAGVAAEADVLWGWIEAPLGAAVNQPEAQPPAVRPVTAAPMVARADSTAAGRVLAAIDARAGQAFTMHDLAQDVGIGSAAVARHLAHMVHAGTLVAEGHTNRRTWRRPDAPPVERRDDRTDRRLDKMLAVLTARAAEGLPCPSNADLGALLDGMKADRASQLLTLLHTSGRIVLEGQGGNQRRVQIVATGQWTDWSAGTSPAEANHQKVLAAIVAAADGGLPCPSSIALAHAAGYLDENSASRAVGALERDGRIVVERIGLGRRRMQVVESGRWTQWNFRTQKEQAPCETSTDGAVSDGSSPPSETVPLSDPDAVQAGDVFPAPTDPADGGSGSASQVSPDTSAAAGEPARATGIGIATDRASSGSPAGQHGSSGGGATTPSVALARPTPLSAALPEPKGPVERPATPKPRDPIAAAIETAVAEGRVTRVPPSVTGASAATKRDVRGQTVASDDRGPFPDVAPHVREAALTLQRAGYVVVTNGGKPGAPKFLIDGRDSLTGDDLVARANKRRARQGLPPIDAPSSSGNGRAA
jgi:DNA-binding MarR family transcriptional regulator